MVRADEFVLFQLQHSSFHLAVHFCLQDEGLAEGGQFLIITWLKNDQFSIVIIRHEFMPPPLKNDGKGP